ncbi:MAG: S8 family serine peptidase [Candidatus Zixiibacteriota bacterium]
MKRRNAQAVVLAALLAAAGPGYGQHYYGGGETIPLNIDSARIALKFDEEIGTNEQEAILSAIGRIDSVISDNHAIDGFMICALSLGQGYSGFLDSVQAIDGVYLVEPYYLNETDSSFLVGLTFCAAYEEDVTQNEIDSINALFGVVTDHEIDGMSNVFVLKNTDSSGYRLLDLANAYYNLPETRWAHPDFAVWIEAQSYRLFDYYSGYQYHTKKVIGTFNSASVWDFAGLSDDTITVAVVDDGITSHEDLPASRVLSGFDFADYDNVPVPGDYVAHGMGCAGIIGASHTTDSLEGLASSSGIISLNPSTAIKPVKIFHDDGRAQGVTPSVLATAITYAYVYGADVLSNSWGYYITCQGAGSYFDVLTEALEKAATLGRDGLGVNICGSLRDTCYQDC